MVMNVGPPGYISHQAWYSPLSIGMQFESVPICSTELLPSPSIPTQVAELDNESPLFNSVPQFAVGTVQLADTVVKVSPVAAYPAQFPMSSLTDESTGRTVTVAEAEDGACVGL